MKQLFKKMCHWISAHTQWLKESNRPAHIKAGLVIFAVVLAINSLLSVMVGDKFVAILLARLVSVGIAMAAVEYIQRRSKIGIWDWLDIIAGCFYPTLFVLIVIFCKCIF